MELSPRNFSHCIPYLKPTDLRAVGKRKRQGKGGDAEMQNEGKVSSILEICWGKKWHQSNADEYHLTGTKRNHRKGPYSSNYKSKIKLKIYFSSLRVLQIAFQ